VSGRSLRKCCEPRPTITHSPALAAWQTTRSVNFTMHSLSTIFPAAWINAVAHRKLIDCARRDPTRRSNQDQLLYETPKSVAPPLPFGDAPSKEMSFPDDCASFSLAATRRSTETISRALGRKSRLFEVRLVATINEIHCARRSGLISVLLEPRGATQEARFFPVCRLLPPRPIAKLLHGTRCKGCLRTVHRTPDDWSGRWESNPRPGLGNSSAGTKTEEEQAASFFSLPQ